MKNDQYIPCPIDLSDVELPADLEALTELIARNVHEVWSQKKLQQGWSYGEAIDEDLKTHSSLVPYEQLSEQERSYDRDTAMKTIRLILKLGYKISK
ncbi:MAG: Ryanodine receptor Ryr [Paludibacteraceae bacterium]|nr:Ryanodine receptor Ryr [Paludibacteraceae bacterium]